MSDLAIEAQSAVSKLLSVTDKDQLYLELGKRLAINRIDHRKASDFEPEVEPEFETLGFASDLKQAGILYFGRVNKQAYELVCGSAADDLKERDSLTKAFGIGPDAVAAALAPILVSHLAIAPAIAAVVAALTMKLFFRPGYDTMCEVWKGKV